MPSVRIVIVVGEANPLLQLRNMEDFMAQALYFYNRAMELAKWFIEFKPVFLLPSSVKELLASKKALKALKEECSEDIGKPCYDVVLYDSVELVLDVILQSPVRQLVFMIAHGGEKNGIGFVQLINIKGEMKVGQLSCLNIAEPIEQCVYFGLHCHAKYFTQGLSKKTWSAFDLTGFEKGSHTDIAEFTQNDKVCKELLEFLDLLPHIEASEFVTNASGLCGRVEKIVNKMVELYEEFESGEEYEFEMEEESGSDDEKEHVSSSEEEEDVGG